MGLSGNPLDGVGQFDRESTRTEADVQSTLNHRRCDFSKRRSAVVPNQIHMGVRAKNDLTIETDGRGHSMFFGNGILS